jgi:hypothetical protein
MKNQPRCTDPISSRHWGRNASPKCGETQNSGEAEVRGRSRKPNERGRPAKGEQGNQRARPGNVARAKEIVASDAVSLPQGDPQKLRSDRS